MHDTALAIGAAVMAEYTGSRPTIVEIGAMNVNGTLRSVAPAKAKYIGIDQQSGPGVDLVVPPGAAIPVAAGSADLVMASSVLEHDMMFWETFSQMCRLAKLGGYVYVNAPSNGCVHSYPVDCWRFYPDAGTALERYSEKTEWPVKLMESFVAERQGDQWNDFVAVFRRTGGARKKKHTPIYHQFNSKNVYVEGVGQRVNPEDFPEDVRIANSLRLRAGEFETALGAAQGDVGRLSQDVAARDGRISELEAALGATQGDVGRLSQDVAARDGRISELEAALGAAQEDARRLSQEATAYVSRVNELEISQISARNETERLAKELAIQMATVTELRRFVSTLSELTIALRNNPRASWNPFRLFRRPPPPILLNRGETEAVPFQLQPPNKP